MESDEDGNNNYTINFDPDLDANIKKFEEYLQMVVDKGIINIRDMNIEELTAVHNMLAALRKAVNDVNKAYSNRLTQAITEIAEGSIAEISAKRDRPNLDDGIKKVVGLLDNYANFQMLDSRSFFYNMGDSSFKIHQALRDGLDIRTQKLQEAQAFFKDALSSFTKKEIKEIIEEAYDFDVTGGKLHMTKAQIMSLYELNKREQGKEHIYKGGIRPTNTKNKRNPKPIMVNQEDVLRIVSTLSNEEIKLADSIQKFLAKNCAAWGNEVTMDMYGYKKFVEEFYFPITSFDAQVNTNDNNASNGADKASMFTILNYGMTKALTPNANNAIDISNIFDVATKHIVEMSNYAGYAKPLSDAMRWFNYRNRSTGESVKGSMYAKYENKGKQYFVELIKDINNQKATGDYGGELTSMLVSGAKTASIAANLSVVVQQPTAYVRASAVLNPDILMKGALVAITHMKKSMAEVKQYCPIAYWKSQGYFDTSLGKNINETITGIKSKKDAVVEASMSLAGLMDDVTWAAIWESTKKWVQENHPDIAVDSQAFFDIASEKFRDVVDQTQVVDTVLHRPMILRSKNALVKMSMAFMSEPLKSANLVRNAALDIRNKKPGAKHKFVRALASSVLANLAAAATKAIIMALRDTGDDDWLTKWLKSFLDDAKNSLNPLNIFPVIKDIISMLNGFDVERMDMTAVAGIVDFAQKVFDYAQKDKLDDLFNLNTVYTLTRYLSQLTGVPVYNVLRDVDAFIDIFGDPIFRKPNTSTSTRVQKLYDAAMANDTEAFNNVYNTLKSEGKTQKEIESSLKSKIIDDSRGNAMFNELVDKAAKERINGNISESVRIVKELASTTALSADFWKACVNARINKLNGRSEDREELISTGISRELVDTMTDDEVKEALKSYQTESTSHTSDSLTEDTGTVSMYTANDLVKSIEDGDYNEYSEMYQDMLEVKVTNLLMKAEQENKELTVDEAEEEARKSIKSSMTDGLKKLIKSLYNSDKAKYRELKKWLMKNLDYSSKTIEGWLTEKE